jgi:hypothetical protein
LERYTVTYVPGGAQIGNAGDVSGMPSQVGGTSITRFFNVPGSFAAGPIRALVWFNPNYTQPPGRASGTVTFTYTPP